MYKTLKNFFISWQLILFIGSAMLISLFSWAYYNYNNHSFSALRFQNVLQQKSIEADNFIVNFKSQLKENDEWGAVETTLKSKPNGIEILVYKADSLCCWTGQVLPFRDENINLLNQRVVKLENTWYLVDKTPYQNWQIFSLISIKTEYSFKNAFLHDEYAIDIPLVLCKEISLDENAKGDKVLDGHGNFLFTALECDTSNPTYANWGGVFVVIFILLFVQVVILLIKNQKSTLHNNLVFIGSILFSIGLYYIHITFQFPSFLFSTSLFSPVYFGATTLFPNLGSLLLFASVLFANSYVFYKYVATPSFILKLSELRFVKNITIGLIIVVTLGFWHLQNYIVTLLVSNSVSAPLLFKVSDLNFFDLIRIFIITLLWLSAVLAIEKVFVIFLKQVGKKKLSVIVVLVSILLTFYSFNQIFWVSSAMFIIISNMLIWVTRRKSHHAYSTFIWFVGIFSIFAVYSFYYHNYNNEEQERKLLIENLSFRLSLEEDPLSEMLLKEMEEAMYSDSMVISELGKKQIDVESLSRYLKVNYFTGYLDKYEMQLIPCWPGGDLFINTDDSVYNCYEYFDSMLNTSGSQVLGSKHFFFLKNQGDIITYFGVFKFFDGKPEETSLFIELVAKPYFEGPGYPELLLSERESKLKEPLANYSYAKYINGQLNKEVGDFHYSIHLNSIVKNHKDLEIFYHEGYSHICFRPDDSSCIILSLPKVNISMILVAFSMFFISFFIFGAMLILITRIRKGRLMYNFSVQERIQIAFIGLMMTLLLVIASGSVWQTIRRFEIKNNQILSEKTKSVLMELEHKLGKEKELTPDMEEYLEYLLKKFSSVFYIDINLYGTNGRLIATSRPELFNKGLSGHLMNSVGFIKINRNEEAEFIHQESIGELKYISAYVPFVNEDNKILAYINMPYFVGTSELRDEVTSLVMAIVNFYLIFLIVVIGLTVVVARRITHPLKDIQGKLGNLRLGKRNEKIEYKGNDEIAQLVSEYNRMVEELSESADKLAKTEREMAWREMARQIAHEIKNPLTPMKLSIQYLEKAKADNAPDFDEKLKRVSSTLIDQIDKLSSIASEFSNFAKMPTAKRKKLDIIEVLLQCVNLFDKSNNTSIQVHSGDINTYYIYADSEQMIGVFNNLLQNAIQSIPNKREGKIVVGIEAAKSNITIKVEDNGLGIPKEVQEKLFVPNFTTKTSGMGLGLAIVKNIVVNSKGKIWFESELDKGTVFYVRFPVYDGQ